MRVMVTSARAVSWCRVGDVVWDGWSLVLTVQHGNGTVGTVEALGSVCAGRRYEDAGVGGMLVVLVVFLAVGWNWWRGAGAEVVGGREETGGRCVFLVGGFFGKRCRRWQGV